VLEENQHDGVHGLPKKWRHHQHMKVERIKFKKKQENKKTQA